MHSLIQAHLYNIAIKEEIAIALAIPVWLRLTHAKPWQESKSRLGEIVQRAEQWHKRHVTWQSDELEQLKMTIDQAKRVI